MVSRMQRLGWGFAALLAGAELVHQAVTLPWDSSLYPYFVGGAVVAFAFGGSFLLWAVPWRHPFQRWFPPLDSQALPVRVTMEPAIRHPLNADNIGKIEITHVGVFNTTSNPLTVNARCVYYAATGYHGPATSHVAGLERFEIPPRTWSYLPSLVYETGPFDAEEAYWKGGAKLVLYEGQHTRELHICLFTRGSGEPCAGARMKFSASTEHVAGSRAAVDTFREDADAMWNPLRQKQINWPNGLTALVKAAPWPDNKEAERPKDQEARQALTMFCGTWWTHEKANQARGHLDGLVPELLVQVRKFDGFDRWLSQEVAWRGYHDQTIKLQWYLGLSTAEHSGNPDPDYSFLVEFRDLMDEATP